MCSDHRGTTAVELCECEKGYEQSGTGCAHGVTSRCLLDNRSDLQLKNRFCQNTSASSAEQKMCKNNRWRNPAFGKRQQHRALLKEMPLSLQKFCKRGQMTGVWNQLFILFPWEHNRWRDTLSPCICWIYGAFYSLLSVVLLPCVSWNVKLCKLRFLLLNFINCKQDCPCLGLKRPWCLCMRRLWLFSLSCVAGCLELNCNGIIILTSSLFIKPFYALAFYQQSCLHNLQYLKDLQMCRCLLVYQSSLQCGRLLLVLVKWTICVRIFVRIFQWVIMIALTKWEPVQCH